jgi:hypothetical protein
MSLRRWEPEADPDVPFTMEISQHKYFSIRGFANFPFTKEFLEEECSEYHRKGTLQNAN